MRQDLNLCPQIFTRAANQKIFNIILDLRLLLCIWHEPYSIRTPQGYLPAECQALIQYKRLDECIFLRNI